MVWQGPTIAVTSLTLVVSLSLVLTLRRPWPVQLNLTGAGSWELILSDGRIFLGEIARAQTDVDGAGEAGERDYTELVEFVRAAVQLAYEELAPRRAAGADAGARRPANGGTT